MFADFFMLRLAVRFSASDIFRCLYRPVAAALAMVFVLHVIDQTTHLTLLAAMVLKIVCGGIAYLGSLTAVWFLAGRPDGIEALAFQMGAKIIGRRAHWWGWTGRRRDLRSEANRSPATRARSPQSGEKDLSAPSTPVDLPP